jgi:hypothetical protein
LYDKITMMRQDLKQSVKLAVREAVKREAVKEAQAGRARGCVCRRNVRSGRAGLRLR